MMFNNQRINGVWKKNLNKFLNKNHNSTNSQIVFQSINTGKSLQLEECLFDELLPYSLASSPISSIEATDNVWIASSMLTRVSDTTENLVVIDEEFPVGIIGAREILKGIIQNPTPYFFHDVLTKNVMNRKFYLDTRMAKLQKLLEQMKHTKRIFSIIQNSKQSFSSISVREILEIGSFCKTNIQTSDLPERKIKIFRRDDSVEDIIKSLLNDDADVLMLENESLVIDQATILEKINGDLNYLQNVENFLDLNASIFKFVSPKLIPDKLSLSEVCKTMLYMKHPYVMNSNRICTPYDVLSAISSGLEI